MPTIPTRVANRMVAAIKHFQPILVSAKTRDINESDTMIIVTGMLSELFGYDQYSEITSEHAIRGTYCDIATLLEGRVQMLLEGKAIGLELKDSHVKQAIDYAANKGVDWVLLTNGSRWRVYKVVFGKPIDQELVFEIDFLTVDPKDEAALNFLYVLTKEGWVRQALTDLHQQRQMLSKFVIGALTLTEPVLTVMRRELKRICPEVKIEKEQIEEVLLSDVLKREVVEGEKADEARKRISRGMNRHSRGNRSEKQAMSVGATAPVAETAPSAPAISPCLSSSPSESSPGIQAPSGQG